MTDSEQQMRRAMVRAYKGERTRPRAHFRDAVIQDPTNYKAWLWLAYTAETEAERRAALYQALLLNPNNKKIRSEFRAMHTPSHYQAAALSGAFMCYSRADDVFAVELAEQIKARKLSVWIDMLDVPLNQDWNEAVQAAMQHNGLMLLILSPESVAGNDTQAELAYFLEMGKPVLPIIHRTCDPRPLKLLHPKIDFRHDYMSGLRMVFTLLGISRNFQQF